MKAPRTLLLAAAVLAISGDAGRADTPPGLLATIEQFDHLTIGNAVTVGSLALTTGHLECKTSSGRAAPVLAGDRTVGFIFEGNGEMQYLAAGLLQYMTKKDYMPFFEKYYWGIEMPKN